MMNRIEPKRFVKLSDSEIGQFDLHVVYDDRGSVVYVGDMSSLISSLDTDPSLRAGLLLCRKAAEGHSEVDSGCVSALGL